MIKKIIKHLSYIRKIVNDRNNLLAERDYLKKKLDLLEMKSLNDLKDDIDSLNFKTNLIMDYFVDPTKALSATGNTRKAQLEMVNILKVFKSIMEKYKIIYWLDYGTLLGAVRHNGFIPWDNDVDVSVLDSDISKIKKILKKELPIKYEFINIWKGFTFRIQEKNKKNTPFIDVYTHIVYGKDKNNLKLITKRGTPVPNKNYKCEKPLPINIIFPLSKAKFENNTFNAPNNTDQYLRLRYGNYNLLPKKKHTNSGHIVIDEEINYFPKDIKIDNIIKDPIKFLPVQTTKT